MQRWNESLQYAVSAESGVRNSLQVVLSPILVQLRSRACEPAMCCRLSDIYYDLVCCMTICKIIQHGIACTCTRWDEKTFGSLCLSVLESNTFVLSMGFRGCLYLSFSRPAKHVYVCNIYHVVASSIIVHVTRSVRKMRGAPRSPARRK